MKVWWSQEELPDDWTATANVRVGSPASTLELSTRERKKVQRTETELGGTSRTTSGQDCSIQ